MKKTWLDPFNAVLDSFGKAFIPEKIRPYLRKYLQKAAIFIIPYKIFGLMFLLDIAIVSGLYFHFWTIFREFGVLKLMLATFTFWALGMLLIAGIFMALIYVYVDVLIFKRTKAMEDVLPDFLTVVSENLRAGMTIDKALWNAIKPEFGVLSTEIKIASKKVMTGGDPEAVLMDLANKYESPMLRRSLTLIVESMKSGGELAEIIDKIVENIKQTNLLKQKMIANAISYTIFISMIVLVIAPGLFALAYNLLIMLKAFSEKLFSTSAIQSVINFSGIVVTLEDFDMFAKGALAISGFFASIIVSSISKGDMKGGLKYMPLFVVAGIMVYIGFRDALAFVFSGLI